MKRYSSLRQCVTFSPYYLFHQEDNYSLERLISVSKVKYRHVHLYFCFLYAENLSAFLSLQPALLPLFASHLINHRV